MPGASPSQAKSPAIAVPDSKAAVDKTAGDKSGKPADAADKHNKAAETPADRAAPAGPPPAAKVVALDAFRKKS